MFNSFDESFKNKHQIKQINESICFEHDTDSEQDENQETYFQKFANNTFNKIMNFSPKCIQVAIQSTKKVAQKSLREKLFVLCLEETKRQSLNLESNRTLNFSTNLLEKLVKQEQLSTIVLNLYAPETGYSLGFNVKNKQNNAFDKKEKLFENNSNINNIETDLLSYDETELFYYINAGEIPPIIIDLIDRLDVNLFYDGCVVLEIRDFRRRITQILDAKDAKTCYDLHFILMQPSMQTLLADLNSITNDGNYIWTQEDKYALESQIILATTQPLCLHPSPIVSIIKNKLLNHKQKLNDRKLKKSVCKYSCVYTNRSARWNEFKLPYPFKILKIRNKYSTTNEYLHLKTNTSNLTTETTKKDKFLKFKSPNSPPVDSSSSFLITSLNFQSVDNWPKCSPFVKLPAEEMILVKKFAKTFEKPKFTNDPSLIPIEEIILEAIDKISKNNFSKLIIKRRSNDGIYFCQLSLRNDHSSDVLFRLGLANEAEKYIQQYIKIFTEEGRRPVTIKHNLIEKNNLNNIAAENYQKSHLSQLQQQNELSNNVSSLILQNENNSTGLSAFSSFTNNPNFSVRKNQSNSYLNNSPLINGIAFQSFFNNNSSIEFNDKQLLTYQNFLYQQQNSLKKQNQQQSNYLQQNSLINQIKRIKSLKDEKNSQKNVSNCYDENSSQSLINFQENNNFNNQSQLIASNNVTAVSNQTTPLLRVNYASLNPENNQMTDNVEKTLTIEAQKTNFSLLNNIGSSTIKNNNAGSANLVATSSITSTNNLIIKPSLPIEKTDENLSHFKVQRLTTCKLNTQNESLNSSDNVSKNTIQNSNLIQIYVPKLASQINESAELSSLINNENISKNNSRISSDKTILINKNCGKIASPNPNTLFSSTNPTKVELISANKQNSKPKALTNTTRKKRANSSTSSSTTVTSLISNKSSMPILNETVLDQKCKQTKFSSTQRSQTLITTPATSVAKIAPNLSNVNNFSNVSTSSNETNVNQISTPIPTTKIINASNLNILRKIALDSRSMPVPVIVTLNSNDSNEHLQQQTIQNQLKLQSQHQNKQFKLLNSRITLKPAITNNNLNINNISNSNKLNIVNANNIDKSPDRQASLTSVTSGVKQSPIKTFQLQLPKTNLNPSIMPSSINLQNQKSISFMSDLNTTPLNDSNSMTLTTCSTSSLSIIKPSVIIQKLNNESHDQSKQN